MFKDMKIKIDKVTKEINGTSKNVDKVFEALNDVFETIEESAEVESGGISSSINNGHVEITGDIKSLKVNGKKVKFEK